jgi:multidrug transporter EmrE-like cation transporter
VIERSPEVLPCHFFKLALVGCVMVTQPASFQKISTARLLVHTRGRVSTRHVKDQEKERTAAIAVFTTASWGSSFLQVFIRLATLESHLAVPVVSAFRFIFGLPLCYLLGLRAEGPHFYRTNSKPLQLRRSALLATVTVTLIAGGKALKDVALANAYTLSWPAMLTLRVRFVHKQKVHPLGWASVFLCIAGVFLLAISSGTAGEHPYLGLGFILVAMYCHVLMMDYAERLAMVGDSSLCSWFWTGVVGFVLTLVAAVVLVVSAGAGHSIITLPHVDLTGAALLVGVTLTAVLPQLGYARAGKLGDTMSLAPWGLTQVIPATAFQMWVNHWQMPNAWAFAGIATLLLSAFCGMRGRKLMRDAIR